MTMRGEKVYECDFDVTGVTDFGNRLGGHSFRQGKDSHRKEPASTSRMRVLSRAASPDRYEGSITRSYAPTAA